MKEKLIIWLFDISTVPYARYFKTERDSWEMTAQDLLTYPKGSLGNETGIFLTSNSFELMDRLETHDTDHVITGYGTDVPDEIAQQYFFYGNGKRTLYMFGVLLLSIFILPDHFKQYLKAYKRGKQSNPLHLIDVKASLARPLSDIQSYIFINTTYIKPSCT